MAEGLAVGVANQILNTIFRAAAWTAPAAAWIKMHVGAPGSAGTANPAVETTRKQITTGVAASGGASTSSVDMTWTAVAGTEDYTHFTVWDASTGGVFQLSGTIVANPVVTGDTFTIAAGDFDAALTVAS